MQAGLRFAKLGHHFLQEPARFHTWPGSLIPPRLMSHQIYDLRDAAGSPAPLSLEAATAS
jgi:hypothetical protein